MKCWKSYAYIYRRSRCSFPNDTGHRLFDCLFDDIRQVVPKLVAAEIEMRDLTDRVLQGVFHNRRKREISHNRLHGFLDSFRALRHFLSRILAGRFEPSPITLENLDERMHDISIPNHHSQLTALVEFGLPKALAAQEGVPAVAEYGSRMKSHTHQTAGVKLVGWFNNVPDDPNFHSLPRPIA